MTPLITLSFAGINWPISLVALLALPALVLVFVVAMVRARRRLAEASPLLRRSVMLLNALALLALTLLLAPPGLPVAGGDRVALVTEGSEALPVAKVVYSFGTTDGQAWPDVPILVTPSQLTIRHPGLDEVVVVGHGLDESAWSTLPEGLSVSWAPPPLDGLVMLDWANVIEPGAPLIVTGEVRWREGVDVDEATIRLQDPSGVTVSSIERDRDGSFALRALPRAAGAVTYRLQLLEGDVVIADEPVSTYVRGSELARLLVMQSAPSFETRQLANWAADRGSELLIDTLISRERSLTQRINLPETANSEVSDVLLSATDLAVIDGRRWVQLDAAQRQLLLDAVDAGLGLMLLLDDALAEWLSERSEMAALLGVRLAKDAEEAQYRLALPGLDLRDDDASVLPVAGWQLQLRGAQTLSQSESGVILESWRSHGRGRLALSRLRERHRWATSGDRSVFTRYWSHVLQTIGRPSTTSRWLAYPQPSTLRPGERAAFCVSTADATPLSMSFAPLTVNSAAAAESAQQLLMPHPTGSPEACGFVWPNQPGWHALALYGEDNMLMDRVLVRVLDDEHLRSDRFARRQLATQRRANAQASQRVVAEPAYVPVSPWWGWGLLVLALVPLWLERRLSDLN